MQAYFLSRFISTLSLGDSVEEVVESDKIHRDIFGASPGKQIQVGSRMDQGSYEDDIYSIKREMELVRIVDIRMNLLSI